MNKFVKSALVMLPVLALAGGLSTSAMADNHGKRVGKGAACEHGKKGGHGSKPGKQAQAGKDIKAEYMMMLSYKLDLTDAQETALKDIVEQQKVDHKGQREAMAVMLAGLAKLEPGSDAYNQQIDTIATTKSGSWAKDMKARGQMQADILALLNGTQKAIYEKLLDDMPKPMGGKSKQAKGACGHSH